MTTEEKRTLWLKSMTEHPEILSEAKENIEKYRKGFCKLHFVDEVGQPLAKKPVKITQTAHDFKFGAHIFMLDEFADENDNQTYRQLFKDYFNLATVPFYWDGLEPEQGKPRFDKRSSKIYRRPAPELCMEYCEENDIAAKLHCLVYDKFTPDWLPKQDEKAMIAHYEERVRQIARHYAGRMVEFEVINETLQEAGWTTQSVLCKRRDFVEWAFALARKYLPNECLVINDGDELPVIGVHDYRAHYFMQIEKCLHNGASIDKIGVLHHIFTGATAKTPEEYERQIRNHTHLVDLVKLKKGMDILSEFGLPLEITEVTIPTFGDTPEEEALQADILEMLYTLWFSHPALDTVVYWNTVDGYAYVGNNSDWNENNCRGGLFHHDLTPKASAKRLYELIHKTWHTELILTTDENGYVEFNGFYGDYLAEIDHTICDFGIHKNEHPVTEIIG